MATRKQIVKFVEEAIFGSEIHSSLFGTAKHELWKKLTGKKNDPNVRKRRERSDRDYNVAKFKRRQRARMRRRKK